jgi:2',3'-cyclic-nucleotide 2'-phosphodiesterase (5'-nucleotidase family)
MLTLLYTHGFRGDFDLMARMYSFIEQTRAQFPDAILVDLGESCAPSVWHCAATEGRSSLVMLDGMGYHAANVEGALDNDNRHKLEGTTTMALVDARHSWRLHTPHLQDEGIIFSTNPTPALVLNVVLTPHANAPTLENGTLFLQTLNDGHLLGIVEIALEGVPQVGWVDVREMSKVAPHPMIQAAAEFVLEEAGRVGKT